MRNMQPGALAPIIAKSLLDKQVEKKRLCFWSVYLDA